MKQRLNIENPFFEFMGRLADIVIANLLFVVCSLPIITMGASVVALYQTMREMREKCFVSSFRSFFSAFSKSFKKSLPVWLFQLITGGILIFDMMFVTKAGNAVFWHLAGIVLGGMLLLWLLMSCYLLPAKIYKDRTVKEAVCRSIYLAVLNIPYTILIVLLNSIPGICLILGNYFIGLVTSVYLVAGFGITAYLNVMLLGKCKEIEEG